MRHHRPHLGLMSSKIWHRQCNPQATNLSAQRNAFSQLSNSTSRLCHMFTEISNQAWSNLVSAWKTANFRCTRFRSLLQQRVTRSIYKASIASLVRLRWDSMRVEGRSSLETLRNISHLLLLSTSQTDSWSTTDAPNSNPARHQSQMRSVLKKTKKTGWGLDQANTLKMYL